MGFQRVLPPFGPRQPWLSKNAETENLIDFDGPSWEMGTPLPVSIRRHYRARCSGVSVTAVTERV
jgi:hypothetical protein